MNKPFTPPDTVPARRDWPFTAYDRPIRGSFLAELDDGRTGLVVSEHGVRFLRAVAWGMAGTGFVLVAIVVLLAALRLAGRM